MFDYVAFKNYLEENGYKQKFIAQKINLTDAVFSAIVTGKTRCSLEAYVGICKTLMVPFGTFLNTDDSTQLSE